MTTIKSHAQRQTTAVDGTLIDESNRVTQLTLLHVYTYYTCYTRVRAAACSQRSMRRVRPFDVLNNNVVFINGKIKCTSIERHVRINRGFVHQVFNPRS